MNIPKFKSSLSSEEIDNNFQHTNLFAEIKESLNEIIEFEKMLNPAKWKYIKPLQAKSYIKEFENLSGYTFPGSFVDCVKKCNGGRPECRCFDTEAKKERAIKSLLSFNKEDKETIWKIYHWCKAELAGKYVPFAVDNFGNLICFDVENDTIIFLNNENVMPEKIADSFPEFLGGLYE